MKTILVPTDFSKNSINAIDYAVALAKKENAKIILLNGFHIGIGTPDISGQLYSDMLDKKRKEVNKKLHALCVEITESKKVKCAYVSKFDLAVDAILETIIETKPDLVIMGTRGVSTIKEVLMGNNTVKIIEKATCPVIAVPEVARFEGIKKITYATDYHASDIDALKKLVEIAKLFNARISVLHVSDEEFDRYSEETYLNEFKNIVKKKIRYDKIIYKLAYGKQLEKILDEEIKKSPPDLLAMSTQHRNLIEKLFETSVTQKMAFHSEVPLMAFHHKKESEVFV